MVKGFARGVGLLSAAVATTMLSGRVFASSSSGDSDTTCYPTTVGDGFCHTANNNAFCGMWLNTNVESPNSRVLVPSIMAWALSTVCHTGTNVFLNGPWHTNCPDSFLYCSPHPCLLYTKNSMAETTGIPYRMIDWVTLSSTFVSR